MLYTFMVEEGFNRSSVYIEQASEMTSGYMNKNYAGVINYTKLTISSLIVLVLNAMPASIQPMLNLMFSGVQQY